MYAKMAFAAEAFFLFFKCIYIYNKHIFNLVFCNIYKYIFVLIFVIITFKLKKQKTKLVTEILNHATVIMMIIQFVHIKLSRIITFSSSSTVKLKYIIFLNYR